MRHLVLTATLLLALTASTNQTLAQEADETDIASPEAIVTAAYLN